jgi:hypothetical protein
VPRSRWPPKELRQPHDQRYAYREHESKGNNVPAESSANGAASRRRRRRLLGLLLSHGLETQVNEADNVYEFEGLKVLVDQMSEMYLEGVEIDYIETLEGAGFKFNNPNVKSTCGCGSSFSV